jgi:hypothetical protein
LTIKYLRRESFSIYPTLLSKIVITADQKAPRLVQGAFSSAPSRIHH